MRVKDWKELIAELPENLEFVEVWGDEEQTHAYTEVARIVHGSGVVELHLT
jgi:hypothetical protein